MLHEPRLRRNSRIRAIERRLAALDGAAVCVEFRPSLSADRRQLYSERARGEPVHAASYIRKRRIVLDTDLEQNPRELARILVHELFHFVWVRLGNAVRRSYEALVIEECRQRARGEMGWSAESRKRSLPRGRKALTNSRLWREYLCESFCDTAACIYSGVRRHPEYTLAARHRKRRCEWFREAFGGRMIPI